MTAAHSALYVGRLEHARSRPRPHRFAYRQYRFYLDLDELDGLLGASRLWRRGRFGPLSYLRDDYFGDPARPLADAVRDEVARQLGIRPAGPVRLLTHLRAFGYVFNPVTFYYCFGADGRTLEAVLADINNTPWGERHAYALAATPAGSHAEFDKRFHVSPFCAMTQRYRWTFTAPGAGLSVTMVNLEDGHEVFSASLRLERRPLSRAALVGVMCRQPLAPWKVHLAIYLQAARLWLKRMPFHPHPAPASGAPSRRPSTWSS